MPRSVQVYPGLYGGRQKNKRRSKVPPSFPPFSKPPTLSSPPSPTPAPRRYRETLSVYGRTHGHHSIRDGETRVGTDRLYQALHSRFRRVPGNKRSTPKIRGALLGTHRESERFGTRPLGLKSNRFELLRFGSIIAWPPLLLPIAQRPINNAPKNSDRVPTANIAAGALAAATTDRQPVRTATLSEMI